MTADQRLQLLLGMARRIRDTHRRVVCTMLYGLVTTVAFALAWLLRFELQWPAHVTRPFLLTLPLLLLLRLSLAWWVGLSTSRWRFVSTGDVMRLVLAATVGSVIFYLLTFRLGLPATVPRSVLALEWVLTVQLTGGMWLTYRIFFERLRRRGVVNGTPERKVLVVGAGSAGALMVGEMSRTPTGYKPLGMVDDDPHKWGTSIHRVEVVGSIQDLPAIARALEPEELIIAIPTATPHELHRIVGLCEETELPFKLLPGMPEVLAGDGYLSYVRPVHIEDLLGRQPVTLELPELEAALAGRCVLVTGAAGSIGSELCRQIALNDPAKLLLLDQAETPLVELDLELRDRFPELEMVPLVADVTDFAGLDALFRVHRPHQVFHAAAYKHVPMMELNTEEAVRNNVLGTWNVARAAGELGSEKLVLISTDKAVRPSSVMGASKRMAEQVVLEAQERYPATTFAAVRFGNVLGSNGSVIPLFRRQMEEGKPLTVTHPEVSRYFMTIPEAVQLVLQASLLPESRGHVAMLEMGEPVKIVELARKMLRLAGRPALEGRDMVFTGLRPGEKLHEELVAPQEETVPTAHPKVRLVLLDREPRQAAMACALGFRPGTAAQLSVKAMLASLGTYLSTGEEAAASVLQHLDPEPG